MILYQQNITFWMKSSMNTQEGLLHVTIKKIAPEGGKKFGTSKMLVKVGDQGYPNTFDLTEGGIQISQVKMFQCTSQDSLELEFNDDKNNNEAELRFPLKKLVEMPRVKHVVEAVLIQKVDKDQRSNHKLKIQNMVQVELEIIYLNNVQGKFIVETMEVQMTRDTELVGQMDPYVIMKLGSKSHTTKAKYNEGKHCIWTERVEMEVNQSGKSSLVLKIYDKDQFKDDLICSTEILLLKEGLLVPSEKPKEREFNLFYEGIKAGTVKIECQFEMLPFNF